MTIAVTVAQASVVPAITSGAQVAVVVNGGTSSAFNPASPGPIGGTTPGSGAFTTIGATGQITSTIATGTAPLVIASTTQVANLNASLLGGNAAAAFIQQSIATTKGDIIAATGSGAFARVGVGADGYVLTADATQPSGMKWAAAASTFDPTAPGPIGGTTPGAGAFTTLSATGQITSTVATGTAPLVVASTTLVANLNAAQLGGNAATAFAKVANNLSDLASASTARTNLGLGSAALLASSAVAQVANNLSDLASAATARTNLGLGSAAVLASSAVALVANNLSDLASASTARTNLGLGSIATQAASAVAITGGTIDGTVIGGTTPAAGTFTTLVGNAGGTIGTAATSGTGLTVYNTNSANAVLGRYNSVNAPAGIVIDGGAGAYFANNVEFISGTLKQTTSSPACRFGLLATSLTYPFAVEVSNAGAGVAASWTSALKVDTTGNLIVVPTTDASSSSNGSITTAGGIGVAKAAWLGTYLGLTSVAAPSLVNGQLWNDSTQGSLVSYQQAIKQTINTLVGSTGDAGSVANTTTETSLLPSSFAGSKTMPANFFKGGKHLRVKITGYYNSAGTPGTLTIRFKLGATTFQTLTISDLKASASSAPFAIEATCFCQATGAPGNFGAAGYMIYTGASGTSFGLLGATGGTAITTTGTLAVDVTAQWATASASNAIWTFASTIEVLY